MCNVLYAYHKSNKRRTYRGSVIYTKATHACNPFLSTSDRTEYLSVISLPTVLQSYLWSAYLIRNRAGRKQSWSHRVSYSDASYVLQVWKCAHRQHRAKSYSCFIRSLNSVNNVRCDIWSKGRKALTNKAFVSWKSDNGYFLEFSSEG